MTPPGAIPKFNPHPPPFYVETDDPAFPKKAAEVLRDLAKNCSGPQCEEIQLSAGGLLLAEGDSKGAQDVFQNMAECASASKDIRHELLARGLIALSEGRILDAQTNLQAIQDHPYAQRLLKILSRYDEQVVALQTLHLLNSLVEEEQRLHPEDEALQPLVPFIQEAIQIVSTHRDFSLRVVLSNLEKMPAKNYAGCLQALQNLAGGIGEELLRTSRLSSNRIRGLNLFSLLENRLMPSHHAGTAYLIAKIYQKDPEFGKLASKYALTLEGFRKDIRWIGTDFLDQGASYFFASWLSLFPARFASRGVWSFFTRGGNSGWKLLLAAGLSWGASTATYFLSEKTLLYASGFDGKIWPASGNELAREFGADMIVMGLSNLLGGAFAWSSHKIFKPLSDSLPWFSRLTRQTLRTPFRMLVWGGSTLAQGSLLYTVHRWEDNHGILDRFRKGKPLNLLSAEWVEIEQRTQGVIDAQKILGKLLASYSSQKQNLKSDEVYHRIHDLKHWIGELFPSANAEQEEQLLGIFWIAHTCGYLNTSAQEYLVKWMKEKRYDKINDFLSEHEIPLQVTPNEPLLIPPRLQNPSLLSK